MSIDLTNAEDSTPLQLSALIGNLEGTKALCEGGTPLNNAERDGETPLHLAANYGKTYIFRYLTKTGDDINIRAPTETATKLLFRVVRKLSKLY